MDINVRDLGLLGAMGLALAVGCGRSPNAQVDSPSRGAYRVSEAAGEIAANDLGQGPGMGGDKFDPIDENPFLTTTQSPLSTFSIDVDTASYAKVRSYLLGQGQMPRPAAVRIEELVNYFDYAYTAPRTDARHPFIVDVGLTGCPWNSAHRLARVALQGAEPDADKRAGSNLVFLIDVSGSMNAPNKLPLVCDSIRLLAEQLTGIDRVSLVVYAGQAGVVLDGASGGEPEQIVAALTRLNAGGSTNGGEGIMQAYSLARDHFIEGGDNRVVLCSDGDFNVGVTGTDSLVQMVEEQAKSDIFLTVLGFGMGNHNDAMLEQVSGRGNGNYFFIDTIREAEKVLVHDIHGTLTTIAKDVKIQIEFNPKRVAAYRLIGYENRMLESRDFNDDAKDAGEVGAGHSVTALYEIVPQGTDLPESVSDVDPLRYQKTSDTETSTNGNEWMAVKLRYKRPTSDESEKIEFAVIAEETPFAEADKDLKFAAAVASFGMLLRESPHRGESTYDTVLQIAEQAKGDDPFGFRAEFCELVRVAKSLRNL